MGNWRDVNEDRDYKLPSRPKIKLENNYENSRVSRQKLLLVLSVFGTLVLIVYFILFVDSRLNETGTATQISQNNTPTPVVQDAIIKTLLTPSIINTSISIPPTSTLTPIPPTSTFTPIPPTSTFTPIPTECQNEILNQIEFDVSLDNSRPNSYKIKFSSPIELDNSFSESETSETDSLGGYCSLGSSRIWAIFNFNDEADLVLCAFDPNEEYKFSINPNGVETSLQMIYVDNKCGVSYSSEFLALPPLPPYP